MPSTKSESQAGLYGFICIFLHLEYYVNLKAVVGGQMFSKQCKLVIKYLSKDSNSSCESREINNESVHTVHQVYITLCASPLVSKPASYIPFIRTLICMLHEFQAQLLLFKHIYWLYIVYAMNFQ